MTRSMTAYGRKASNELNGLSFVVEIHSVNRRMLDVHMNLPKELLFLDIELRKILSKELQRGQVTAKVFLKKNRKEAVNLTLLKKLKQQWQSSAKGLGYDKEAIDLPFLLEQADRISLEELGFSEKALATEVKKTFQEALKEALLMKEKEGEALAKDVQKRVKHLSKLLSKIETLSKGAAETIRKAMLEKLSKLIEDAASDERVLKEIALLAEKGDVTEEITRLHSHFSQVEALLKSSETSVGRSLDFLTQEILRELNTIGSKSPLLEVTNLMLEGKAELEKIREQVQNIE